MKSDLELLFQSLHIKSVKYFNGGLVTRSQVVVMKANRKLPLIRNRKIVKKYRLHKNLLYLRFFEVVQTSAYFHYPSSTKSILQQNNFLSNSNNRKFYANNVNFHPL